jgi:UPF0755 protein
MVARLGSLLATVTLVGLLAAVGVVIELQRAGPAVAETTVEVPRGAGVNRIGAILEERGAIRSALMFRVAERIYGGDRQLQAGEYAIPAGASVRQVVALMASGRVVQYSLTIPEGWTSAMVADALNTEEHLSGPNVPVPAEGTILPETYQFSRGMDRADLLEQMQQAQADLLERAFAQRGPRSAVATPEQAIILASIVQKETGPGEEARVAAVFTNRLRRNPPMRLESDPTIIYGLCQCPRLTDAQGRPRGIRQSELDRRTAYNTYQIDGLPPGPIANPGRAAILAVLDPPASEELFFVAKEHENPAAGHVFSATYAEHNAAVQRLRAMERAAAQTPAIAP